MTGTITSVDRATIHYGKVEDVLPTLDAESFDACLCDPPYHLASIVRRFGKEGSAPPKHGTNGAFGRAAAGFMGQQWDGGDVAFRPETWQAVLRCLRPGASVMAFAAPKNVHRLAVAIEDAGAEIRDRFVQLVDSGARMAEFLDTLSDQQAEALARALDGGDEFLWLFGSGMPKSHNIQKALDRRGASAAEVARFDGYGSGAKPAYEPCVWAQKPNDGGFAENALQHGVAGINIEAGRVDSGGGRPMLVRRADADLDETRACYGSGINGSAAAGLTDEGRWPANILHDGSPEVLDAFPDAPGQMAETSASTERRKTDSVFGGMKAGNAGATPKRGDSGSAARFFYNAKADGDDRHFFCPICADAYPKEQRARHHHGRRDDKGRKLFDHLVFHPTVKPRDLCRYMAAMLLPPPRADGQPRRLLVPFSGTGSEIIGALDAGWDEVVGIEMDDRYITIDRRRIEDRAPLLVHAQGKQVGH